jgi:hypothetical protein
MATIGTTALTLADYAKRRDENGKIPLIAELLNQTNEVIDDMLWVEGNLPTGHKTTIRSGLPTVTWRKLNYGVQPSKSRTVQVTDACGMLEAYSEIDKALADLNGNSAEFRLSEDRAFLEAMNQQFVSTLFYGDTDVDPEKFMGLASRFDSTSAENGGNIIKADSGASGNDQTSIWLVCWGDQTVHGIFPKGSKAGLSHEDLGQDTLVDGAGGKYEGYRSHYKWDCGLTVRDWRYIVRVANIDTSALTYDAASGSKLIEVMTRALETCQDLKKGRPVFYCNRKIKTYLRTQIANKVSNNLTLDNVMGKYVMSFDGIPVKMCEGILNTEAVVS